MGAGGRIQCVPYGFIEARNSEASVRNSYCLLYLYGGVFVNMTVQGVFDIAKGLMNDSTDRYQGNVLAVLNSMAPELTQLNISLLKANGENDDEILSDIPYFSSFSQLIEFGDVITMQIIPFGLSTKLILEDYPDRAIYFNSEFQKAKSTLIKARVQKINNVY